MKLSVSIVTYQQEAFIRQALSSVLAQQTDFPFEVIVGDDASRDGTRDILREMQAQAPDKVRLLLADKNYGDSGLSNFMATVDASQCDYIAFLDGDDYWTTPHKLQRQVDFQSWRWGRTLRCLRSGWKSAAGVVHQPWHVYHWDRL